jgi:hypothetical protein
MTNKAYVTSTHGMRGWFAVLVWFAPEGFWEPWQSGIGSYDTQEGAEEEAREWAEAEGIEFKSGITAVEKLLQANGQEAVGK